VVTYDASVQIVKLEAEVGRHVDHHGSRGVHARAVVRAQEIAVTVLHVAASGEIGRHPAAVDQLFLVVNGCGAVSGGDQNWQPVTSGDAVVWQAGEEHATRAEQNVTAVVVEMPGLRVIDRSESVPE
jgi:quercetin dioxygenase-like cupin family protein